MPSSTSLAWLVSGFRIPISAVAIAVATWADVCSGIGVECGEEEGAAVRAVGMLDGIAAAGLPRPQAKSATAEVATRAWNGFLRTGGAGYRRRASEPAGCVRSVIPIRWCREVSRR